MGNWKHLKPVPADILKAYSLMNTSSVKEKVATSIIFEDQKSKAVLTSVFAMKALFDKLGVKIKYRGIENLRQERIALVANHQGGNLDAFIINTILFMEKSVFPFVPVSTKVLEAQYVGKMNEYLKYVGSFFIKSSFEGDKEYMLEVQTLMNAILETQQYLLIFLEGRTSKHGKPCTPKRGLIKSLCALSAQTTFIPVSITYESALNDGGAKSGEFGVQKVLEGLMTRTVGNVYVSFGKPILSSVAHLEIVESLRVAIYSSIPILTVDILATLLLDKKSLSFEILNLGLQWVERSIIAHNIPYIRSTLEKALNSIEHLLVLEDDNATVSDEVALIFYRNRALQLFYGLTIVPAVMRNECAWFVKHKQVDEQLQLLGMRIMDPLVQTYMKLLASLAKGEKSVANLEVLVAEDSCSSCYTVGNLLEALQKDGMASLVGDNVSLLR